MERLGLVEAIQSLRLELADAINAAGQEELRFEVGQLELEFQVVVERSATGGVKFWVVELGAEGTKSTTHAVRVPLTPRKADGTAVLTGSTHAIPNRPELDTQR